VGIFIDNASLNMNAIENFMYFW